MPIHQIKIHSNLPNVHIILIYDDLVKDKSAANNTKLVLISEFCQY